MTHIEIAIPSSNRCKLLADTTMKILIENNIKNITIFVSEDQVEEYKNNFPDIKIQGVTTKGIGRARTYIRQYYPVKFAGFVPYDNEYFMKPGYTLTPKYTGGHLILEVIRPDPIFVSINHFEDFVANALYFLIDKKLLRFNGTYVKTKYFNANGGIIDYYGGRENRKKMATQLANMLTFIFSGLLQTKINKTHDICNLKFKYNFVADDETRNKIISSYMFNKDILEED